MSLFCTLSHFGTRERRTPFPNLLVHPELVRGSNVVGCPVNAKNTKLWRSLQKRPTVVIPKPANGPHQGKNPYFSHRAIRRCVLPPPKAVWRLTTRSTVSPWPRRAPATRSSTVRRSTVMQLLPKLFSIEINRGSAFLDYRPEICGENSLFHPVGTNFFVRSREGVPGFQVLAQGLPPVSPMGRNRTRHRDSSTTTTAPSWRAAVHSASTAASRAITCEVRVL
jgi:hypothetical protein